MRFSRRRRASALPVDPEDFCLARADAPLPLPRLFAARPRRVSMGDLDRRAKSAQHSDQRWRHRGSVRRDAPAARRHARRAEAHHPLRASQPAGRAASSRGRQWSHLSQGSGESFLTAGHGDKALIKMYESLCQSDKNVSRETFWSGLGRKPYKDLAGGPLMNLQNEMAKLAVQQIEAAFTASRDGGDA